jgi:hypothetical protein
MYFMLREALDSALAAVTHDPQDAAVVALARLYAARIDRGEHEVETETEARDTDNLKSFGPPLLAVLKELRMTPAARAKAGEGGAPPDDESAPDEIDELEARRADRQRAAAGQHDPPAVD